MKRKALGVLLSIMMLGTCVITGCGEGGSEAPASGSRRRIRPSQQKQPPGQCRQVVKLRWNMAETIFQNIRNLSCM